MAVLVLFASCVLPALALTIPGPDFVRRRLAETTAKAIEGTAHFGRIEVQPLGGTIEVWDVVLEPGIGAVRELRIDHGLLRVTLGDLLAGRLRVESLVADGLTIRLEPRPSAQPSEPGPLFDVRILERLESVSVARGAIEFINRRLDFEIDVRGIRVDSRGGGGPAAGTAVAGPIRFRSGGIPEQRVERARLRWNWQTPRLHFRIIEAHGPAGTVAGDGVVSLTTMGILLRGHLDGTLDLARLAPGVEPPVTGPVRVAADYRVADPGPTEVAGTLAAAGPVALGPLRFAEFGGRFFADGSTIRFTEAWGVTEGGTRLADLSFVDDDTGWVLDARGDADVAELLALVEAGPRASQLHGRAQFRARARQPAGAPAPEWEVGADVLGGGTGYGTGALSGRVEARGGPGGSSATLRGALDFARVELDIGWAAGGFEQGWSVTGWIAAAAGEPARTARAALLRYMKDEDIELPAGTIPLLDGGITSGVLLEGHGDSIVRGDFPFRAERPTYGTAPLALLEGRVRLGAGAVYDVGLRLSDAEGDGIVASISGAPGRPIDIAGSASALPLPVLRDYVRGAFEVELPPLAGTLDGTASGTMMDEVPSIEFNARGTGSTEGLPSAHVALDGVWTGEHVTLRWADLAAQGLDARFAGTIDLPEDPRPWGVHGSVELRADLAELAPYLGAESASGLVDINTQIDYAGLAVPLVADGRARWQGVEVNGFALPDGFTRLEPLPEGTGLRLRTTAMTADVDLLGACEDPRLTAELRWRDLDVLHLASVMRRAPVGFSLDIMSTGSVAVAGPARRPAEWRGQGRIEQLDVLGTALGGRLESAAEVVLEGDGWVRLRPDKPLILLGAAGERLSIGGGAGLLGAERELGLRIAGSADLNVLEALHPDLLASGVLELQLALDGAFGAPRLTGTARITEGQARLLPYAEGIDQLAAQVEFNGDLATISGGTFRLGGGRVGFGGTVRLRDWQPDTLDLRLMARSVALSAPRGMWGRYDADLEIRGPTLDPTVSGSIVLLAGRFTQPFEIDTFPASRARALEPVTSRAHWLSRINLRLRVTAADTLAVRNDIASLQAAFALDITGDMGEVLASGSIVLLEGGFLTFRGIEYDVISGQVLLDDPRGEPIRMRLRATTEVAGYDIRLDIDASEEFLDYTLTSVPALSRSDILALLLTGKEPGESSTGAPVSSELAAGYFGAQLGEFLLSAPAKRYLGLTRFQIESSTATPTANPTARVTLGRRLGDKTTVLYSRDLSAESNDLYRIERELTRKLRMALGYEEDAGIGADLRWLRRLGEANGRTDATTARGVVLRDVILKGLPAQLEVDVRRDLSLRKGRDAPAYVLVEARDKLRQLLAAEGYLEAVVRAELEQQPADADGAEERPGARLIVNIEPGPRWEIVTTGPEKSVRRTRRLLEEYWATTEFRPGAFRQEQRIAREALAEDGYAAALVDIERPDPARALLTIDVDPGPRVEVESAAFEGVTAFPLDEVAQQVLSRPPGAFGQLPGVGTGATIYRPRTVAEDADAIETLYAASGYLEAEVEPQVRFRRDGEKVRLVFMVKEGPQAKVGRVQVAGDWPEALGPATSKLQLRTGMVFTVGGLKADESQLRQALDAGGYWTAAVASRTEVREGVVDVQFRVRPGDAARVAEVRYEGLEHAKPKLVEGATAIKAGEPLTAAAIRKTESDLFKLGLFREVAVIPEPIEGRPGEVLARIVVEENPRLTLVLSGGYDTEESLRGSVSLTNDNLFGRGRVGSVQVFASGLRDGVRTTLEDRYLRGGRTEGLLTFAYEREDRPGFGLQTTGGTLQVSTPIRRQTRWQLRYQLEDNKYYDVTIDQASIDEVLEEEGLRLEDVRLGGLLVTYIKDRRNDPFTPRSGWILTMETGVWAEPLLSQEDFTRVTGQLTWYYPKNRFTFAASGRIGLAWPYGDNQAVTISKRFFAGGSDSLRAWDRDEVGPQDASGDPLGGEGLLVANFEARYQVFGSVQATLFYDVGNVWEKASQFYDGDLRKSLGAGVRLVTPVGAIRAEYGYKLDRREGESAGQFFLSIGEPF